VVLSRSHMEDFIVVLLPLTDLVSHVGNKKEEYGREF
jgi:hypothetical protein